MFERSISSPTGFGLHHCILELAKTEYAPEQIMVIVANHQLAQKWLGVIPGVVAVNWLWWQREQVTDRKIIIVDEMQTERFGLLLPSLKAAPQPVWLVNRPLP